MKRKMFLALLMVAAVSVMNVYADDDYNPNYITVNVDDLAAFDNIISNANFDIEFTQSSTVAVQVYGDPDLVDNVSLAVVGKTLYVGNKKERRMENVKVIITAPELLCAIVSASGDIDVKNLVNEKFTATVIGSGDIELTGSCDDAEFTINGSGDIDADEFIVDVLKADVNGSGSMECVCVDILNANIVGSGDIELSRRPRTMNVAGRKAGVHFDR